MMGRATLQESFRIKLLTGNDFVSMSIRKRRHFTKSCVSTAISNTECRRRRYCFNRCETAIFATCLMNYMENQFRVADYLDCCRRSNSAICGRTGKSENCSSDAEYSGSNFGGNVDGSICGSQFRPKRFVEKILSGLGLAIYFDKESDLD